MEAHPPQEVVVEAHPPQEVVVEAHLPIGCSRCHAHPPQIALLHAEALPHRESSSIPELSRQAPESLYPTPQIHVADLGLTLPKHSGPAH